MKRTMMMKKMHLMILLPILFSLGLGQIEAKIIQTDVTTSDGESAQKTMQKTASKSSMLRLGVPLSLVEFQQMTQSTTAKVKSVSADFCVGIMDDEEQIKSIENIQYRVFQGKYAIEQVILSGKTENFSVSLWSKVVNKQTKAEEIKLMKHEVMHQVEKGQLQDTYTGRKFAYTDRYSIRKRDQDDLIHAYFNGKKLIALDYMVQC